jgi:hypothetical protein
MILISLFFHGCWKQELPPWKFHWVLQLVLQGEILLRPLWDWEGVSRGTSFGGTCTPLGVSKVWPLGASSSASLKPSSYDQSLCKVLGGTWQMKCKGLPLESRTVFLRWLEAPDRLICYNLLSLGIPCRVRGLQRSND